MRPPQTRTYESKNSCCCRREAFAQLAPVSYVRRSKGPGLSPWQARRPRRLPLAAFGSRSVLSCRLTLMMMQKSTLQRFCLLLKLTISEMATATQYKPKVLIAANANTFSPSQRVLLRIPRPRARLSLLSVCHRGSVHVLTHNRGNPFLKWTCKRLVKSSASFLLCLSGLCDTSPSKTPRKRFVQKLVAAVTWCFPSASFAHNSA